MLMPERERRHTPPPAAVPALETLLLASLAMAARIVYTDSSAHYDEFFHVLAAGSWIEQGTLQLMPSGQPYERGWFFTYLVGLSYELFGQSIWAARLPSLLAGVGLVTAVFGWLYCVAGRMPAWLGGMALAFLPIAIDLSAMARFYSLQALAMWIVGVAVYMLFRPQISARSSILWALAILIAAPVALHLQQTSLIGFLAFGTWAALALLRDWLAAEEPSLRRRQGLLLLSGVTGAILVLAALLATGQLAEMWHGYRAVTDWAASQQNQPSYYHQHFLTWYRAFWYLLPAATVLALARYGRPAFWCAVTFAVCFLLHSFAGMKAPRYIFYALPHFVALWGLALGATVPLFHQYLTRIFAGIPSPYRMPRIESAIIPLVLAALFGFWLYNTPATHLSARLLAPGDTNSSPFTNAQWADVRPELKTKARDAGVLVTTSPVKSQYYFGRVDATLNRSQRPSDKEFAADPRTGKPVIWSRDAVKQLMGDHASGLIIADKSRWQHDWAVPDTTASFIQQHMTELELPEETGVMAYHWSTKGAGHVRQAEAGD